MNQRIIQGYFKFQQEMHECVVDASCKALYTYSCLLLFLLFIYVNKTHSQSNNILTFLLPNITLGRGGCFNLFQSISLLTMTDYTKPAAYHDMF